MSLSARRAWIEMFLSMGLDGRFKVALRKESVDRNYYSNKDADWVRVVALRKESVDRNIPEEVPNEEQTGRSPQGERG